MLLLGNALSMTKEPLIMPDQYSTFIAVFAIIIIIIILIALIVPRLLRRRRGIGKNDQRHIQPKQPEDSNYNDFWGGRPM